MDNKELFVKLAGLDVNSFTETKEAGGTTLTYLSWANAWKAFLEIVPDATYEVRMFDGENGTKVPYCGDAKIGYMVFTSITANGTTRECFLPVMDNTNKAMKAESYTYSVKKYVWNGQKRKKEWNGEYEDKTIEAMTMFDVNKAIMRCLAKNIAMFGLGLYIYAGEDLPFEFDEPITDEQVARMRELNVNEANACRRFKVEDITKLTRKDAIFIIQSKEESLKRVGELK